MRALYITLKEKRCPKMLLH